MSLSILNQINEFRNSRGKYSDAEKQILKQSFREELRRAAAAEENENNYFKRLI